MQLILPLVFILLIGGCYGWISWRVMQRWGVWFLVLSVVVCALLMTKYMQWRIGVQQANLGVDSTAIHRFDGRVFQWLLPFWVIGFGAVSWFAWERYRAGVREFTWKIARQSVAMFAIGVLAYLIVFAVLDFTALLS